MKHITRILTIILSVILIHANTNAQPIPNRSFENWTYTNGIPFLEQWQITAGQPSDTISPTPSIDSYDSMYALQMKTKYVNGAGTVASFASSRFAVNQNPSYLQGYYKAKRKALGFAKMTVNLYSNGTKIGKGTLLVNDTIGNYAPFSVTINYTQPGIADEAEIAFYSDDIINYALNNTLWIDKISFSNQPLMVHPIFNANQQLFIYPNPVKDVLQIEVINNTNQQIKIRNIFGQQLSIHNIYNGINSISTQFLPSGIYWIETSINNNINRIKFIKE